MFTHVQLIYRPTVCATSALVWTIPGVRLPSTRRWRRAAAGLPKNTAPTRRRRSRFEPPAQTRAVSRACAAAAFAYEVNGPTAATRGVRGRPFAVARGATG